MMNRSRLPAPAWVRIMPQLLTAEIGNVDASTIVTQWSTLLVTVPDVEILVNSEIVTPDSIEIQESAEFVYFILPNPCTADDVLTIAGLIVTNNISGGDPIGDVLRADMKAYWTFNEVSGTRIDATGNGNDLVDFNSVASEAGKLGLAAKFERSLENYLLCETSTGLDISLGDFTIFGWVKLRQVTDFQNLIEIFFPSFEDEFYIAWNPFGDSPAFIFQVFGSSAAFLSDGSAGDYVFLECSFERSTGTRSIRVNNASPQIEIVNNAYDEGENPQIYFGRDVFGYPDNTADADANQWGTLNRLLASDERNYLWNDDGGKALFS